jgi:hypothetical protein
VRTKTIGEQKAAGGGVGDATSPLEKITREPDNTVGFFHKILECHMDFSDVLVSKHNTFVAQIEMDKDVITILKRNLVQIKAHLVVPFGIPIFVSRSSLLLILLQFFVRIMADK